jgi:hypothetical protein
MHVLSSQFYFSAHLFLALLPVVLLCSIIMLVSSCVKVEDFATKDLLVSSLTLLIAMFTVVTSYTNWQGAAERHVHTAKAWSTLSGTIQDLAQDVEDNVVTWDDMYRAVQQALRGLRQDAESVPILVERLCGRSCREQGAGLDIGLPAQAGLCHEKAELETFPGFEADCGAGASCSGVQLESSPPKGSDASLGPEPGPDFAVLKTDERGPDDWADRPEPSPEREPQRATPCVDASGEGLRNPFRHTLGLVQEVQRAMVLVDGSSKPVSNVVRSVSESDNEAPV